MEKAVIDNEAFELPVLVTGASGMLARMIIQELLHEHRVPADKIIATTRTPEKLHDLSESGVVVRKADFEDAVGLTESFSGARRALIISVGFEVPYVVGRRASLHKSAIAAAVEAGVNHVLYSSAPNSEPGNPAFWHADHYETEVALLNSGLTWSILRIWDWPNIHYRLFWEPALHSGVYYSPTGNGRSSFISKEDTAAALAAALLSSVSINRRFDITGTEALSSAEIFRVLENITHKRVEIIEVPLTEWVKNHWPRIGRPDSFLPLWRAHMEAQRGGWFGGVTDAVEELTGRKPQSMVDYLPGIVSHGSVVV